MSPLSTSEALTIVCPVLEKHYQDAHASLLAKLKMLQLIQQTDPIPSHFSEAWTHIQARSQTEAAAIAELVLELQNLLDIGHPSELW